MKESTKNWLMLFIVIIICLLADDIANKLF